MGVTKVRVELFKPVIDSVLHDLAGKDVMRTTLRVLNRAKVLTPVDTGNLRASHQFRIKTSSNKVLGEVFTNVKYALPVHQGRGALVIRPKSKQALAFVWHGRPMVRRSVFQPARKGRPWMSDALKEVAAQQGYKVSSSTGLDGIGNVL